MEGVEINDLGEKSEKFIVRIITTMIMISIKKILQNNICFYNIQ